MTKRISMISLLAVFASCFLLFPISASAIPALGVAPGAPGSEGTYFGPYPSDDDLYQLVFADTFVGGEGGFAMPTTGGELSIWYGANNGIVDEDKDVYLLTTSLSGNSFAFSVDDDNLQFEPQPELDVASYRPPIHGVNLGSISGEGWTRLTAGEFGTDGKEFWVLTGIIKYSGFELGGWMYAATTNSSVVDQFSPQTTSSTVVPEPTALLLVASGLIGLAGFRRRFKMR